METMIQEQQQHGRCEQINRESNNGNKLVTTILTRK